MQLENQSYCFNVLRPYLNTPLRILLNIAYVIATICVGVALSVVTFRLLKSNDFFTNQASLTAILILIIPLVCYLISKKLRPLTVDSAEVIGTLDVGEKSLVINISNDRTELEFSGISYLRINNAMGWSSADVDAYQIQIILKNEEKIDLDYVSSRSKRKNLKRLIDSKGIKHSY